MQERESDAKGTSLAEHRSKDGGIVLTEVWGWGNLGPIAVPMNLPSAVFREHLLIKKKRGNGPDPLRYKTVVQILFICLKCLHTFASVKLVN